jgi:hypothetical protein
MRESGFTLVEFLWACSGLTATGAAAISLVTGSQQQEAAANSSAKIAKAILLYAADNEDTFPLAVGRRDNGTYRWSEPQPAPADVLTNYELSDSHGIASAESYWANAIEPHITNSSDFKDAGQLVKPMPGDRFKANVEPIEAGITMNGLLHSYPKANVTHPGIVPLAWAGTGSIALKGRAFANPTLVCNGKAQSCRFAPRSPAQPDANIPDGDAGVLLSLASSFPDYTIWAKPTGLGRGGGTMAMVDGSARFLQWGTAIAPAKTPDATQDPYLQVRMKGSKFDGFEYWSSDSADCSDMAEARKDAKNTYPCFFRPDRVK